MTPASLNRAGEYRYAMALRAALREREDVELQEMTLARRVPRSGLQRVVYQGLAEVVYYPLLVGRRSRDADVLHYPRHLVPPTLGVAVPTVLTLHDILPVTHPEYFSPVIAQHQRLVTPGAARRAARVLTGSEATRQEILRAFRLSQEQVLKVPYGVERRFRPVARRPRLLVESPYVLCVGTLEPRKNLRGVIEAMGLLAEAFPDHALVVTGGRGWQTGPLLEAIERSRARVVPAGYVSDEELVALYSAADCFAYPSFAEGFGFPVLEAMACGAPVVTSARSSLPEVAGDAAELVDPDSPDSIARGIESVLTAPERAEDLRRRGIERAALHSWDRTAAGTVEAYREALSGARHVR